MSDKVASMDDGLTEFQESQAHMRVQFEILRHMVQKAAGVNVDESNSPKVLSDLGKELSQAIKAEALIEKYFDSFKSLINLDDISNPYDLQEACFDAFSVYAARNLSKILAKEELESIKTVCFYKGMHMSDVHRVLAFVLRDKLMPDFGWSIEEKVA